MMPFNAATGSPLCLQTGVGQNKGEMAKCGWYLESRKKQVGWVEQFSGHGKKEFALVA